MYKQPADLILHNGKIATQDDRRSVVEAAAIRDGKFLAKVPDQANNPFGRPIFQNLQYSDTPTQPLVPMRYTDTSADAGKRHTYRVIAVNTVGSKSAPSAQSVSGDSR